MKLAVRPERLKRSREPLKKSKEPLKRKLERLRKKLRDSRESREVKRKKKIRLMRPPPMARKIPMVQKKLLRELPPLRLPIRKMESLPMRAPARRSIARKKRERSLKRRRRKSQRRDLSSRERRSSLTPMQVSMKLRPFRLLGLQHLKLKMKRRRKKLRNSSAKLSQPLLKRPPALRRSRRLPQSRSRHLNPLYLPNRSRLMLLRFKLKFKV